MLPEGVRTHLQRLKGTSQPDKARTGSSCALFTFLGTFTVLSCSFPVRGKEGVLRSGSGAMGREGEEVKGPRFRRTRARQRRTEVVAVQRAALWSAACCLLSVCLSAVCPTGGRIRFFCFCCSVLVISQAEGHFVPPLARQGLPSSTPMARNLPGICAKFPAYSSVGCILNL